MGFEEEAAMKLFKLGSELVREGRTAGSPEPEH